MLQLQKQDYLRTPHATLARALEAGLFEETKIVFFGPMRLVLGHPEIQELLKDTDRFAVDARNAGHDSPFGLRFLPGSLKVLADNLLGLDDPRHRQLRQMVDEPFRRTAIDELKPSIEEMCDRLVDNMLRTGETDLVPGLCRELPLQVIFELLGFSDETRAALHDVMKGVAGGGSPFQMIRAIFRLKPAQDALRREFERVRAEPQPGLVSELVHAEADGERMTDDELLAMVFVLFVAGHETTSHLISTSVYTLLTHPGAADQYRAGDENARGVAVDELMRYCTPVQMTKPRHPREDMEFHGAQLKKGERIMALLAAGNVDPRVFDDPLTLNLARRPNRHLGWGGGPHLCLGLHLARAEAQAALSCLFDRFPHLAFTVDPDKLRWIPRSGMRGLKSLPLGFQ
ncbi:cytochrome P450 [Henriciella marina]|uniref:cytochrome P450 n=1 Tax=Henriciella marina TaxID=453851 RepID=UPI000378908B|nr:cytochrome P450 [Henriciella marina]